MTLSDLNNIIKKIKDGYIRTSLWSLADTVYNSSGGYTGDPTVIIQDTTHRFVSDTEKSTWNGKESGGSAAAALSDANDYTDSLASSVSSALSGKSDTSHNHSGIYEPVLPTKTSNSLKYLRVKADESGYEYATPSGGSGTTGQTTIAFAGLLHEDRITVTSTGVTSASKILLSICADNDSVLINEWEGPMACNFQTNQFDILLRNRRGKYKGNVKINYSIS